MAEKRCLNFSELDSQSPASMTADMAYIQKLLSKDSELRDSWNDLNRSFDENSKKNDQK